jgi:hypothetical protein
MTTDMYLQARRPVFRRVAAILAALSFTASAGAVEEGKWAGPRLADGQPDVQGVWSNDIANHDNFTAPRGGIPGDPVRRKPRAASTAANAAAGSAKDAGANAAAPGASGGGAPAAPAPPWPSREPAPSRVSDPADGEVPFQPWARAKQQELLQNFFNPTKPEYIEPGARCAPAGIPKSLYWHGYEIRQFPHLVVFLFNGGTRVIYLDDRPHLPAGIKLWNADSRGHWEGNTLVVNVQNNNAKARFARTGEFASENVHVVERYTFGADHYTYNAVFTDPTVYTRPFTVTIPAHRITEKSPQDGWNNEQEWANLPGKPPLYENYERVCVENNGGHGALAAASAAPTAPAASSAPAAPFAPTAPAK